MINLFKKIQQIVKATIEKTRKEIDQSHLYMSDYVLHICFDEIDITFTDDYKYAYVLSHTLYEYGDEKYKKSCSSSKKMKDKNIS